MEGAAGEFNNPANAMTMRSRTRSQLGETTVQVNCQARSDASSTLTIPVTGAKNSNSTPTTPVSDTIGGTFHKSEGNTTGNKGDKDSSHRSTTSDKGTAGGHGTSGSKSDGTGDAHRHGKSATVGTTPSTAMAADNLQRIDSDVYAEDVKPLSNKAPTWLTTLISVLAVGAVGTLAFELYQNYRDRDDD